MVPVVLSVFDDRLQLGVCEADVGVLLVRGPVAEVESDCRSALEQLSAIVGGFGVDILLRVDGRGMVTACCADSGDVVVRSSGARVLIVRVVARE